MKRYTALLPFLGAMIIHSCTSIPAKPIPSPVVYSIKEPVAGNYPQGLYKYPHRQNSSSAALFLQTLEWGPRVHKTFAVDTQYTAVLTLTPASSGYTFEGVRLEDVQGLPGNNVLDISAKIIGDAMEITIVFAKTAQENAEPQLLFSDDFDGNTLDSAKWAVCPNWDRHGRSTWTSDMVSVRDGYLRLGFKRDAALGSRKTSNNTLAHNWIQAGAVRTQAEHYGNYLFENTYGYYEARIQFPKVDGVWGAFWLMSPTQWILTDEGVIGTEIDIVESIANHKNSFNAALHWNGYGSAHKSVGSDENVIPDINIYDGEFHVFALDWSPEEYIFYVDGVEFWRCDGGGDFRNSGINRNPNYIKLSVESADWSLPLPPGFTEGEMVVDYVKVYNQPVMQ